MQAKEGWRRIVAEGKNSAMPGERQLELDALRGLAPVLMVTSHSAVMYALAIHGQPGDAFTFLWLIGETAPAWFFFAFGMTFDQMSGKPSPIIFRRLRLFFYLAVVHNACVGHPVQVDFLAFLWLAQVFLLLIERFLRPTNVQYAIGWCALIVSMLAAREAYWDVWFRALIPGFFPLVPWVLFVVAGMLCQRWRGAVRLWPFGIALVVLALAAAGVQPWLGRGSWRMAKLVLTAPYAMLLTGCAILVLEAVRHFPAAYRRLPIIPRLFDLLSRNLLLATVLHYLPLYLVLNLEHFLFPVEVLRAHHRVGVVVAILVSVGMLVPAVHAVRWWWARTTPNRWIRNEDVVGVLGVIAAVLLWQQRRHVILAPNPELIEVSVFMLGFVPIMVRLALGMRDPERRRPA